ncbi:MAG: phospho-sugar mutase [Acidobacteria bacterium]|nr:phospho-sugar mutase [Acidobacteriota bacterium]
MTIVPADAVLASARAWIDGDPDPVTRAEMQSLIDAGAVAEIAERMDGTITFGTAGLRGRVEAGSNRMNRATVIRVTRGLADYLIGRDGDNSDAPVVVGYDARLSSRQFVEDTVGVLAAAGLPVVMFDEFVPTPLVAYAALAYGARAAIVVTASHNPPQDNGYKVFDSNGAQIVQPVDRLIADAADAAPPANQIEIADLDHAGISVAPMSIFDDYLNDLADIRTPLDAAPDVTIAYSAMHGVGGAFIVKALRHFGYSDVHVVAEQFEPDGRFPTLPFPNPEEPGAMDLLLALAETCSADVALANDPDADRLAVAIHDGARWTPLTGNQIGWILGEYLLSHRQIRNPFVGMSIVSSPLLRTIAKKRGTQLHTTLTGFKWIWNAALDIGSLKGSPFLFGYEEALGYSVGPAVRDKDGLSAAVVMVDLVARLKATGETLHSYLVTLGETYGRWVSVQRSVKRPGADGAEVIAAAMDQLRRSTPREVGGIAVVGSEDFMTGADQRPRYLPSSNLIELSLGNRGRVLVRPSGTEPKLKIYVDLAVASAETLEVAEETAKVVAEELVGHIGLG